ncbi:integrase core domain-containing protein [Pleomorphomonas oryzae]|uniref:integrase core domain-containing protein n=1 Tax=Pleomorphomonas oryzae TaxID=261934 RepID=UPI003CCBB9C2
MASVEWHYIVPGKPTDNGLNESFTASSEPSCSTSAISSLTQTKATLATWRAVPLVRIPDWLARPPAGCGDIPTASGSGATPDDQLRADAWHHPPLRTKPTPETNS